MSLSLRELATKTSWPHSSKSRLTHGEWVPASMAMRMGCSEAKRRLKASGLVRSLPSSISSPLCWSMRHRGRSICRRGPIRLSCLGALCYHPSWADPPFTWVSSKKRARIAFAGLQGTAYLGGRPSHPIFRERQDEVRRIFQPIEELSSCPLSPCIWPRIRRFWGCSSPICGRYQLIADFFNRLFPSTHVGEQAGSRKVVGAFGSGV
jgi:hypothetical protein